MVKLVTDLSRLRRNSHASIMKAFQIIALSALAVVLLTSTAGRLTSSLSLPISTASLQPASICRQVFSIGLFLFGCDGCCGLVLTCDMTWMCCRCTGMCRPRHQPEQCMRLLLKCHQGQRHKDPASGMQ